MARLAEQHKEIDALNRRYAGRFRLLKGIEANIRADGTIDMEPHELRQLEIVVAAPHSALRSAADQTSRMVKAVRTRGVHILGHPRGRKDGARPGVSGEVGSGVRGGRESRRSRSKSTAIRRGRTSISISRGGDASRDASSRSTATRTPPTSCATPKPRSRTRASRAVPRDRIVNCWPLKRLLAWAAHRSG